MERIGPGDLVELVTDVGPVPLNVGALLVLADTDAATVEAVLAQRLASLPRLRQRLAQPPWGLGRPYWVDDPGFDVGAHLSRARCPAPGDDTALLALALDTVTRPLPRSRPLWRGLVVELSGGGVAVVVVLHHVLADGIGGLAMLARLADGVPAPPGRHPAPRPAPGVIDLLADRAAELVRTLRAARAAVPLLRRGRAELGLGGIPAPRCSLNAPTGPRRRVVTVEADLAPLRTAAHRCGGTVNDVLLVATGGALADLLRARGERVAELVVSVPVSSRPAAAADDLGNQVGVMPVRVPATGDAPERLATVAGRTRAQKSRVRGASAALVGPAFRFLAAMGVFRWFVDRQRLVNSFLTNMTGPAERLTLAGAPVLRLVPITTTSGNVAVAFAALSYAGRLSVTVIVDPDLVPDLDALATGLRRQLHAITRSVGARPGRLPGDRRG
ncbi:wax ester/triacylglycerol synthase domain-containing protein [Georgenia thermotolerans]|uniref:wax ester/triacylglycerol synthase domain-containing protein n=1 Tax=Georgenia thermotolerans TaxID=527326 RepID=UPI001B8B2DEA|nr:wax ester/triacylglycerol synthase domain-containing protein [Georgenia thermotolerans]